MNEIQEQVFVGSMLGDGSLHGGNKFNWSFCKKQKIANREYLDWHFNVFENLSCSILKQEQILSFEYYKRKNKQCVSKSFLFTTHASKEFTELGHKWYKNDGGVFCRNKYGRKMKIVPSDLRLTALSLAVWFCDDGTNTVNAREAAIYTNSFSRLECGFLKDKLFSIFGIKSSVNTNRSQPIIRIAASSYIDFIDIIKPHITWSCFQYKIQSRKPKNGERHWRAKLSDSDIDEVKLLYHGGLKQSLIAERFHVSRACICNILKGKRRS